ncbi:MAG: methylated-DNA--[protein]-cysteine S-methyltransferase [Pseudomonadota bacterium]
MQATRSTDAPLSEAAMEAAYLSRDAAFDGRFIIGVLTTGIYCRPTCPARPPKPENVLFYETPEAARAAGFRACKRCAPDDKATRAEKIAAVARFIEDNADERLPLDRLAEIGGLSAGRLQKSFKDAFGVSPKAYQEAVRAGAFKRALKSGDDVAGAAFEAGYGSTSRVYETAVKSIGMTPSAYREGGRGEHVSYVLQDTVIGRLMIAATDRGICFVQFADEDAPLIEGLRAEFPNAEIAPAPPSDQSEAWAAALAEHLKCGGPRPDLPLDLRGTAFQMKVWRFLMTIPEGDVLSYTELAEKVGNPKAVRAAASACARNRVAILIPCHRVLRSDGSLGGYRWGLDRKRALLDQERARAEARG